MEKHKHQLTNLKYLGVISLITTLLLAYFYSSNTPLITPKSPIHPSSYKPEITKTEAEWKSLLTPQQYHILRQKGTDTPFSETILLNKKRPGTYVTADCGEPVFRSENKYDSGTGWPSFWKPIEGSVVELEDKELGLKRIEILGKKCGGHLGHVFKDGPEPTGLRYCINPSALKFIPDLV